MLRQPVLLDHYRRTQHQKYAVGIVDLLFTWQAGSLPEVALWRSLLRHGGKETAVRFLVGQVMKATGGRADAGVAAELLTRTLEEVKAAR